MIRLWELRRLLQPRHRSVYPDMRETDNIHKYILCEGPRPVRTLDLHWTAERAVRRCIEDGLSDGLVFAAGAIRLMEISD